MASEATCLGSSTSSVWWEPAWYWCGFSIKGLWDAGSNTCRLDAHHVVHIHAAVFQETGKFEQEGLNQQQPAFFWPTEHYFGCCSLPFLCDHLCIPLATYLLSLQILFFRASLNRVSISIINLLSAVCNLIMVGCSVQTVSTQPLQKYIQKIIIKSSWK